MSTAPKLTVLLILLALTVAGCPKPETKTTVIDQTTPPATSSQPPTSAATPPATPPAQPATGDVTPPATPPPTAPDSAPEPPNPRPTGTGWVFTPKLTHYVGENLVVEYSIDKPNPGKAWVGLIPEDISAQDEPSNDAADVAYAYTVDAQQATLNIEAPKTGKYRLRFFAGSDPDSRLVGESPLITVTQWPAGDRAKKLAPYVTINATGTPASGKIEVQETFPVVAYFEVPAGYSDKAWLGVVPADVTSPLEAENDAVDVSYMYLNGRTKDSFTWKPDKLGTFVFRLFPNSAVGTDYVAESEPFTVIPKGSAPAK
jgi:hypothetical protein